MQSLKYAAAITAASFCISCEHYMDITDTYVDGEDLYISGTLNALTYDEIAEILDNDPGIERVVLENIDGSIDDEINLQTGLLIHRAGLDTYVPAHGDIASGAVDLFCAGNERIVERGAQIGVHTWGFEGGPIGADLPKSHDWHRDYIAYFEEVGCPVSFYWFTLQAASVDDVHIMSEAELIAQGVATQIVEPAN